MIYSEIRVSFRGKRKAMRKLETEVQYKKTDVKREAAFGERKEAYRDGQGIIFRKGDVFGYLEREREKRAPPKFLQFMRLLVVANLNPRTTELPSSSSFFFWLLSLSLFWILSPQNPLC